VEKLESPIFHAFLILNHALVMSSAQDMPLSTECGSSLFQYFDPRGVPGSRILLTHNAAQSFAKGLTLKTTIHNISALFPAVRHGARGVRVCHVLVMAEWTNKLSQFCAVGNHERDRAGPRVLLRNGHRAAIRCRCDYLLSPCGRSHSDQCSGRLRC
jgi:hypothetical protein